ncbi:MAG: hypothetical protein JWP81_2072 [Ferruginibacter sp.]|nr:hypothetical protein [Ferruginibacter sp.]
MKSLASFLISLLAIMVISCKKEPTLVSEDLIPVNDCRVFNLGGDLLTCCLDSVIQDSRCPENAVCIWQGVGVARFSVNMQSKEHFITLATDNVLHYRKDTSLAGFKIEMINLLSGKDLHVPFTYDQYVAEVKITKR